MKSKISPKIIFAVLFLLFFVYLIRGIDKAPFTYWDEVIYVPGAWAYLTSSKPFPVPDHPPFGKEVIAVGIKIFGYGPLGWRFFSVLFGALSCTLISYFSFRLTKNMGVALFIAALIFLEPLLVVHFRMAMLDPPLTFLLILSTLWAYLFYSAERLRRGLLVGIGIALGLALATKLLALVFIPVLFGLIALRLWREPQRYVKMLAAGFILAFFSVLMFLSTYWVLGYTTAETWELVEFMFNWHRTAKGPSIAMSRWYEWLFIKNPIFYTHQIEAGKYVQVVMVTGNFVTWIGAQLAALYCMIRLWRRPEVWMLVLLVAIQFFLYTQKSSTYLHYMTEILPFLYLLLAMCLADLFARYGKKYRKMLWVDLAVFYLGALVVFVNYWPKIWGMAMPTP